MTWKLLGSAPTFDRLLKRVREWYYNPNIQANQTTDGHWQLSKADGTPLYGMRIIQKKNRFRFEMQQD